MRPFEASLRFVAIVVVACAVLALGLHHHDSYSPEPHCAVCHLVVDLASFGLLAASILILPRVSAWLLPPPPDDLRVRLHLAACGLRAPPASL